MEKIWAMIGARTAAGHVTCAACRKLMVQLTPDKIRITVIGFV